MSCIINNYKSWSKTQLDKGATQLQLDYVWLDTLKEKRSPEVVSIINRLVSANRGSMEFAVAYNNTHKTVGSRLVDIEVHGDMIDVHMQNGVYTFKKGEVKSQPLEGSKVKYLYMPAMEVTSDKMLGSEAYVEVEKGELEITRKQINSRVNIDKLKEKLNRLDKVGVSKKHQERLDKVLDLIVSPMLKAIPDMEIYLDTKAKRNGGVIDISEKEIRLSVGTQDRLYGTDMSAVETMVHELGHGATHFGLNYKNTEVAKQINILKRLRSIVMDKIKPEDLLSDIVIDRDIELKIAEERIRYMSEDTDGRNSLEEFVMYALTNEKMIDFMETVSLKDEFVEGKDWFEKLVNTLKVIIEKAMSAFGKEPNRTLQGDALVMKMVAEIAAVNNKIDHKAKLIDRSLEFVNGLDDKFAEYVEELQDKNADEVVFNVSKKMKEGKKLTIKEKVKLMTFLLSNSKSQPMLERMLKKLGAHPVGLVQTVIRHLRHADEYGNRMQELTMASGQVDSNRENTASSINEMIASTFKNKLSKNEKRALYGSMVMGDVAYVADKLEKFKEVVTDEKKLNEEIEKREDSIRRLSKNEGERRMLMYQIDGLARLMKTGKGSVIQRRNAEAIAQFVDNVDENLIAEIDMLSSLYSLKAMDTSVKDGLKNILEKDEAAVIDFGKTLVATREYIKSKQTKEQNINMMKNYHRETYDNYVTSKVAPYEDKKIMAERGYKLVKIMEPTGLGFDGKILALYVSRDMIRQPFNRSAIRYTGDKQSGLLLFETALKSGNTEAMGRVLKAQRDKGRTKAQVLEKAIVEGRTLPEQDTNVLPELDENGKVVDFRTLVTTEDKIEYLGLEMNPMEVIGRTWGHEVDVEESAKLTDIIWEEIMLDAATNARVGQEVGIENKYGYTTVDVSNPVFEVSDIARILPPQIKDKLRKIRSLEKAIKENKTGTVGALLAKEELVRENGKLKIADKVYVEVVGENVWNQISNTKRTALKKTLRGGRFMVRENMILDAFGARDMSLADWKRMPKQIKTVVRKIEKVWKEIVKIFKVDIVIRLLPVIMGNIVSNLMYSVQTGHSPLEVAKLQLEAVEELKLYIKNKKEISKLFAKLAKEPNNKTIKRKIERLKSDIKNSPIYPLIKAGMYQHIVEDVGLDDFKSNSRFMNWIDDKTESWPEMAKVGMHWLYVSEKTSLFQMITKATAYSDFAARYAQHTLVKRREIKKIKEKTGKEPSVEDLRKIEAELAISIRDAFVNYSQPDSRVMQYMNDMGLIMFTKYMVRIQKVIQDGIAKHPLRFTLALLGQETLDQTIGWEPDDIAEKTMYGRGLSDMFYSPGFTGILEGIIEPQLYTYLKDAMASIK